MLWILVPAGALTGAAAGVAMRVVLGRLARGALVRPPLCEVAVAVLWAAVALVPAPWVPLLSVLTWLGVAVTVVDLRHHRIPDALTFPALPLVLVCVIPLGGAALCRALGGAALAAAVHAAVHLASPRSMGAGDVKLAAPLGAVLAAAGWFALPLAAVLAALLTATVGIATVLVRAAFGRRAATPDAAVPDAAVPDAAVPDAALDAAALDAAALDAAALDAAVPGVSLPGAFAPGAFALDGSVPGVRGEPGSDVSGVPSTSAASRRASVRGSPHPHGPSMVVAAVLVTGWFAVAGAVPAPDQRGSGPASVPADRVEVEVVTPGWA